ncbi:MAG: hypothetical protein QNJ98_13765 [Planctomycetota bacterium]|nr:hypothetical protein [Planctomycetota bacterium]
MGGPLLDPGQSFDDAWTERVLALDTADREQLLSEADALRGASRDLVAPAFACYRALGADLDPESERDAPRLLWLLRNAREPDPLVGAVAERATGGPEGGVLQAQARLTLALFTRLQGDWGTATDELVALRRDVEGWGDLTEGLVLSNLGVCLLQAGRAVESLFLLVRAAKVLETVDAQRPLFMSRHLIAIVLSQFEDWERFDKLIVDLEEQLAALPPAERKELQFPFLLVLAGTSLDRERYQPCLDLLEEIEAGYPERVDWVRTIRPFALVGVGRAQDARDALATLEPQSATSFYPEAARALCAIALDPERPAHRRVAAALDRLDDPALESGPNRSAMQLRIARRLEARVELGDLAKRAYDAAAAALLARIQEVETFYRDGSAIYDLNGTERRVLGDLRQRMVERRGAFRESVTRLLLRSLHADDSVLTAYLDDDDRIGLCAWCGRVRHRDGTWIPVGAFVPDDPLLGLSHGICDACAEDELRAAPASSGARP